MNAEPPPRPVTQPPVHVGALASDLGVHGASGNELGSHMFIENHGAGLSSTQWETSWPGRFLQIGELVIGVRNRRSRCVMTTFDPDTLEQDGNVLLRVVREFEGRVALDCWVEEPGRVAEGDPVHVR